MNQFVKISLHTLGETGSALGKGLPREGMWSGQMEMEKETVLWFNASQLKFNSDPNIPFVFFSCTIIPWKWRHVQGTCVLPVKFNTKN